MMNSLLEKRRSGASLAEMVVALYVLGVVLLGMMAGILITQGTMLYKERERATEIALRKLESLEALPFKALSDDITSLDYEGIYTITTFPVEFNKLPATSADSADIRVAVSWGGGVLAGERRIDMKREVSSSGWQSVGEIPD
jgi:Tfp pilus assembly protein PilV